MERVAHFEIQDLLPIALTLVVVGIGVAYGLNVMGDVKTGMLTNTAGCNSTSDVRCGSDYNATGNAITGVAKLPEKLPLIATVVVAAIIIGILVRYMFMSMRS